MSIVVSVSKGEKLKRDEVIRRFKETNDLEELKKIVENSEDRFFLAWDTVEVVDHDGEIAKIDEDLIKAYDNYINERNGPITDNHTNRVVGQTHAYKVMTHPETGKLGILTLNRIFNTNSLDDKVWKEIKTGKRKGVSIGGQSKEQKIATERGLPVRILEDMDIWEKGTVYEPANPLALTEAVSVFAKGKKPDVDDIVKTYQEFKKPFAGYKDFDDCVRQNQDKENPEGYCAEIMRRVEGDKMKAEIIKEEELTDEDFKKADEFIKAKYPWDQCIRDAYNEYGSMETARRVCGAIRWGTVRRKNKTEGDDMEKELKKQDENDLESRIAALEEKIQEIEQKLAPAEEVSEETNEETPEEETKDTGTTPVNPSPEGGTVKLPESVTEKIEDKEPDEEKDKIQMMEKELKEIKKKLESFVSTPRPEIVEKAETKEEEKTENPAMEILKAMREGKKVTMDFARNFIKKSRDEKMKEIFS